MKKLLFFIVCVAFAYSANAQSTKTPKSIPTDVQPKPMPETLKKSAVETVVFPSYYKFNSVVTNQLIPKKTQKAYNYTPVSIMASTSFAECILGDAAYYGGQGSSVNTTELFPDSLGVFYYKIDGTSKPDSGFRSRAFPGIGFTFDPYSKTADEERSKRWFEDNATGEVMPYRLDTLRILGDYRMANYDPNSKDTLRVYITHHNAYNMPAPYTQDDMNGYEYFTLKFTNGGYYALCPLVEYGDKNNIPQKGSPVVPRAEYTTVDYVLDDKDSADIEGYVNGGGQYGYAVIFARLMKIPVNLEIPVGHVMSVMIKFIPGYSYDLGDTIQKIYYNASLSGSNRYTYKDLRYNTFAVNGLYDTAFINFCDMGSGYNCRLAEDMGVRYNTTTWFNGSWNPNRYTGYIAGYLDYPYVEMNLSVADETFPMPPPTNSVTEANTIVSKIYPNPSNNQLKIELINDGTAELNILNTVGQVVKTVSLNEINNSIDISSLSAGMYMLKVSQNGTTYTTKITKK